MTKSKSYRLRITMKPFGGVAKTAYYENFRLKDNVIFFQKTTMDFVYLMIIFLLHLYRGRS